MQYSNDLSTEMRVFGQKVMGSDCFISFFQVNVAWDLYMLSTTASCGKLLLTISTKGGSTVQRRHTISTEARCNL